MPGYVAYNLESCQTVCNLSCT